VAAPAQAAPTTAPAEVATQAPTDVPGASPPSETQPLAAPAEPSAAASIPDDAFTVWHGMVREGGAYRRSAPSGAADIIEELDPGTPIRVDRWIGGGMLYPDVITWGEIDPEDGGGYIFGGSLEGVLPPAIPPPPEPMQNDANWVDVNLTLNVVSAYVDGQPIKSMLASPGRPGFETATGVFSIRARFTRQNMSGPGYFVPGVPDVQYFYGGQALHGRYWTLPDVLGVTSGDVDDDGFIQAEADAAVPSDGPNRGVAFGVPSSHGCVGLELDDALWLYSVTGVGEPVDVHY
jgi:hypothetical protein